MSERAGRQASAARQGGVEHLRSDRSPATLASTTSGPRRSSAAGSAKNRHNLDTMGLSLAVRWVHAFVITLLAMAAWELYRGNGVLALAGLTVATLLFSLAYFITVERALMRFRSLRPQYCSIYDPYFWWHERYWKFMAPLIGMLNGTRSRTRSGAWPASGSAGGSSTTAAPSPSGRS